MPHPFQRPEKSATAKTAPSGETGSDGGPGPQHRRLEIRKAGPGDAGRLSSFLPSALLPHGYPVPAPAPLAALIDSTGTLVLLAMERDELSGAIGIRELPWDSERLHCCLARIEFLAHRGPRAEAVSVRLIEAVRHAGEEHGWNAIWLRIAAGDLVAARTAARAGAELMGTLVTFRADLNDPGGTTAPPTDICRPGELADVTRLREIARAAFRLDRYHRDPLLDDDLIDELWAQSAENALRGRAEAVLVAESGGVVQGFVTLHEGTGLGGEPREGTGVIGLIAVAEAAAGRGLGKTLVDAALDRFRRSGLKAAEVGTQGDNVAAMGLYASAGFRPRALWLDYRLSLAIAY